jgi:acetyl esterase/lipase
MKQNYRRALRGLSLATAMTLSAGLTFSLSASEEMPGHGYEQHDPPVESLTWDLWPGKAPGECGELPPETYTTRPEDKLVAGRPVIRLTNVTVPTLTIYKPDPALDTRTAVIIAPGGGHRILAMDLEGTEVAEWLNSIGVTAILLKYRVPGSAWDADRRWVAAAQDGQRAMSLVRDRLYEPVDEYDNISFRPDFAAPVYAGGIPQEAEVTADCPPTFMVVTSDDRRPESVAEMYIALKKANVKAELHIFESGGHGYGLRKIGLPVSGWPDLMEDWMRGLKLLDR